MSHSSSNRPPSSELLTRILAALLCAALYLGIEWLYIAFKPSFLRTESALGSLEICLSAFLVPLLLTFTVLLCDWLMMRLARPLKSRDLSYPLLTTLPAVLLTFFILVLADTTLYIFCERGIVSLSGIGRLVGVVAMIGIYIYSRELAKIFNGFLKERGNKVSQKYLLALMIVVPSMALSVKLWHAPHTELERDQIAALGASLLRTPNILFIASDGLNANHLSAYGYARQTTPFLNSLKARGIMAENAFPNSCTTTSSVPSLLSGRLPTTTKVIYYPDVFRGKDSYLNLPAVLKAQGYKNYSVALDIIDPYLLNMRSAFDEANGRNLSFFYPEVFLPAYEIAFDPSRLLLMTIFSRAQERLLHIAGTRDMYNHNNEVNRYSAEAVPDRGRIEQLKRIFRGSSEPFFVHVHLMGTHGPRFFPRKRAFSWQHEQESDWDQDFYDDAILDFDSYLREIFEELESAGKLENTLIVINSDHGIRWSCNRTPLILIFPTGKLPAASKSNLSENVQHLDLAPTVLSYLGIKQPAWMEGRDLLTTKLDPLAPIFITSLGSFDEREYTAPFFDLKEMSLLVCQRLYKLNLKSGEYAVIDLADHTAKCAESTLPNNQEAREMIMKRLRVDGYRF